MSALTKLVLIFTIAVVLWCVSVTKLAAVAVEAPLPSGTELVEVFSDDFSAPTLTKWQIGRSSSGMWQVVDGVLRGKVLSASSISELLPKPAYWHDDWGNYRFSLDLKSVSGADRNLSWNYQDPRNWYEAHFVGNTVELYRLRAGQTGYVSSHQFFLTPGVWHRVVVEVHGQAMKLWVDGWLVADVIDWYTDGRQGSVALKVGTGAIAPTEVWFDNVKVELLTATDHQLSLAPIKQSDLTWGGEIYDRATSWSTDPTIKRWGCALTSLVMVLRYYGFTTLPSGEIIDPSSLNQWLLAQPDGYVADGWVNWLAAERLTRQIVATQATGLSLRFSRWSPESEQVSEIWQKIQTELHIGRPVIVAIPNHFMVARGVVGDLEDIVVNDPWYEVTTLGQHELADRQAVSLRLIEPYGFEQSNATEGWLIETLGVEKPQLTDAIGELIADWQEWVGPDRGGDVGDGEASSSQWKVWWMPKLPAGQYQLSIDGVTSDEAKVRWLVYSADGTVHTKEWTSLSPDFNITVLVQADGSTVFVDAVEVSMTWVELVAWWDDLQQSGAITDIVGWLRLKQLLQIVAAQVTSQSEMRYRQLIVQSAAYYETWNADPVMSELISKVSIVSSVAPE